MHDPFPIPPIPWLSNAVQPIADYFHLTTIPLHIHEVLLAFLAYTFVDLVVAPVASRRLFPQTYATLSREKRLNWNVHVVSLVQSVTINSLALWVILVDQERKNMDWTDRVWGYTGAAGMIQALATGYFLWDLLISLIHIKIFGPGLLAHAVSAFLVFSFGFRPFVNFYGCTFILYELSSPFLNFHWFFDKLGMTGSRAQLYNGIFLLFTFFCCRLLWGTYQSIRVYQDIWAALHYQPPIDKIDFNPISTVDITGITSKQTSDSLHQPHLMGYSSSQYVPVWLSLIYLGSNLVLNFLNFYWFRLMIATLRKRFDQQDPKSSKMVANGTSKSHELESNLRKRNTLLKTHNQE
ncbi:putative TLC domain-containing protein C17A2.02c [Erysiphe neolycopersici]|uniref:Putative TLC domain-containing protein C17A2.02c n=1 Tax=Erysiphe neolycopersici TaxID=212602 RepID=A0A420H6S8_9PEZI|nr:putative TLC domain-containing protein C17A2.02c [Erysiphe neolycopersici]